MLQQRTQNYNYNSHAIDMTKPKHNFTMQGNCTEINKTMALVINTKAIKASCYSFSFLASWKWRKQDETNLQLEFTQIEKKIDYNFTIHVVKHKINTYLTPWPHPLPPYPWKTSKVVSQFVNQIPTLSSFMYPNYSTNYSQLTPLNNYLVNAIALMQ